MQPTRRAVLLGAGVSALAACTPDRSPRPATPSLEDALRADAVVREQTLVTQYQAALLEQPALSSTLAPALADHHAHLAALRPARATPTPSTSASAAAPPPTTKRDRAAVLAGLVALERATATAHADAAARVETGATCDRVLAPLLASLAACEASHAAVL